MKVKVEVDLDGLIEDGSIPMEWMIEHLCFDKEYTKNSITKASVNDLEELLEYIKEQCDES